MGHITGCRTVYNRTSEVYSIVKQEWSSRSLIVPAYGNNTFSGESFPWCENPGDIIRKAFRFYRGAATLVFYAFQDQYGGIAWSEALEGEFLYPDSGLPTSYESRHAFIYEPVDSVNLTIESNGKPTAAVA
jgi:hypothetical protein